jgi:ribosome-associated toxin RatA of RatAB toxin-antitoxin module
VALNSGQPVVTGEKGQYVGKVLITAPLAIVWRVLTDYEGGVKYMPNLVSSRILEVKGNQKVIEQVSARRVLTFKVKSRLRTLVSESEPKRIDFRLIEGDLKQLQGFWQIEPIAPRSGKLPTQFLLTYQVMAQPSGSTPKGIFHNIFKNSLPETLKAVRGEIERRSR